jgi:hypothetical protein
MKNIAFGALGLGLLLLVLSGLWLTLFPGTSSWTAEKSAELTKIKDRRHALSFIVGAPAATPSMHSGPDTGEAKKEFDELTVKKEALLAEFNSIHDRPYTIAKILKWSGIGLALAGIIGIYAANQQR